MAFPLDKFVAQLQDSGVLASDTLQEFLPPKAAPASGEELAAELVRRQKLTKFQAEEISRGRGKSLILGNYVLLGMIGAGGMGQVFKAQHRIMERLVAVKVLPSTMTRDPAALSRFQREVKAAARLNHPNIVTAFDADHSGDVHFLVMELVEGSDLSAVVKKNGPLPAEQAVNFILQAAKGLDFAHKKGIVHRDIKPANLLLDGEGNVKILDMGLARIQEGAPQATPAAELTSTGTVMGTVDYMAPEQALNTKSADARADIYALGCSLHFLLTGRAIYSGDSITAKLLAHQGQAIPRLSQEGPVVPEQLEGVFRKMVAKDVSDRYQTVTELIPDLESCVAVSPTARLDHDRPLANVDVTMTNPSWSTANSEDATILNEPADKTAGATTGKARQPTLIVAAVVGVVTLAVVVGVLASRGGNPVEKVKQVDSRVPSKQPSVTAAQTQFGFQRAGFDRWVTETVALPAERQLEAINQKLQELNPSFKGKLLAPWSDTNSPAIKGGRVIEAKILIDNITDLSPLRALTELDHLRIVVEENKPVGTGPRLDLSPLSGMKIRYLGCSVPNLDITAVKNLPLLELSCIGGAITDLTPVSGLPLKRLTLSGNWWLQDLSPLKGMKLNALAFDNCQVADLSPLTGMALEELSCDHSAVTDLTPLAGMKLKYFTFTPHPDLKGLQVIRQMDSLEKIGTQHDNVFPRDEFWKKYDSGAFNTPGSSNALAFKTAGFDEWGKQVGGMPAEQQLVAVSQKLKELNPGFDGQLTRSLHESEPPLIQDGAVVRLTVISDKVTDLSPIRALPNLHELECGHKQKIEPPTRLNLSPLSGTKIRVLRTYGVAIELPAAKDLALTELACISGGNTDLSMLSGLSLIAVTLTGNWELTNLQPLKGMPLVYLTCDNCLVSDLSPLNGMPLATLLCHVTKVSDLTPLKGMPLEVLSCEQTLVKDLSPLAGLKLKKLSFTPSPELKGVEAIRQMDSLMEIGTEFDKLVPREEFWKKYDAGEFDSPDNSKRLAFRNSGFDQWVKQVTAMRAEHQLEAVSQKLKELNPGFDGQLWGAFDKSSPPLIKDGEVVSVVIFAENLVDVSPLRALPKLEYLECIFKEKKHPWPRLDLSPLSGMKIRILRSANLTLDLSKVKDLPLAELICVGGDNIDLTTVSGTPLQLLMLSGNWELVDLRPLKGMQLARLICDNTQVSDLSPLTGAPLVILACNVSQVADLTPLKGMPLEVLHCEDTLVKDLSPLAGLKLKKLSFTPSPELKGIEAIRQMDSLMEIGIVFDKLLPRDEFWKKYDAGELGK